MDVPCGHVRVSWIIYPTVSIAMLVRWAVKLIQLESRPFSELTKMLKERNDPRITLFGEWIGWQYRAQVDGSLGLPAEYMGKMYNLTDEAIRGDFTPTSECKIGCSCTGSCRLSH